MPPNSDTAFVNWDKWLEGAEPSDVVRSGDTWSGVTCHLLRILPCLCFGSNSVRSLNARDGGGQHRMLGAHVL